MISNSFYSNLDEEKITSSQAAMKSVAITSFEHEFLELKNDYSDENKYIPWKQLMGTGGSSKVYMKFDYENRIFVALKCMQDEKYKCLFYREHEILKYIQDNLYENFPNLFFKYYGLFMDIEYDYPESFYHEKLNTHIQDLANSGNQPNID